MNDENVSASILKVAKRSISENICKHESSSVYLVAGVRFDGGQWLFDTGIHVTRTKSHYVAVHV